jgi:hypothetical protein
MKIKHFPRHASIAYYVLSIFSLLALNIEPVASVSAQVLSTGTPADWTLRIEPDIPPEALGQDMVYDTVRNVVFMVGSPNSTDTWELSGNTWTSTNPAHSPGNKFRYGLAYDEFREKVVLFGGNGSNETWLWNGTDWTLTTPTTTTPSGRAGAAMAFDRTNGVVLMYGGDGLDDLWEWNGSDWAEKHPLHTPGAFPYPYVTKMVYDTARNKFVLFRSGVNETWEYDYESNDWVKQNPITFPTLRPDFKMTYDETTHRTVLITYGGPTLNEVWDWDGTNWTNRTPAVGPSARSDPAFVYDNSKGKIVLYGGFNEIGPKIFKDTWVWDDASGTWTQLIVPRNPPMSNTGLAYDSARGQVVRFGGTVVLPGQTRSWFGETWVLGDNDSRWTQKFPAHQPPILAVDGLAYDSHRERVVLFAGSLPDGTQINETWEWDGMDWSQIYTTAWPANDGAITFDSDRGVVVLFDMLGHTWVYDGINWEQKSPQHSPSGRYGSKMVFDSRRHVAVMFGAYGPTNSNETWEWDGNDWTLRALSQSPEPRSPAMAYDETRGVTVVFGGVGQTYYNDTWEYDGNNWAKIQTTNSPSARAAIFGTYSLNRRAVVLFGGIPDDTWEYRSANNPPSVGANGPYSVNEGSSILVSASGSDPDGDQFSYAWDLDNDGTFETPGQSVIFSAAGFAAPSTQIIAVQVVDSGGLTATDQTTVKVIYNFSDFLPPVDPLPTLNSARAGASVPVKFSLNGYKGLSIFDAGYPKSQSINCDSNAQVDTIEETVAAGASGLSYNASTDTYTYVWKTNRTWTGCRQLVIKLNDGTFYRANFNFTK